jgi:hypothetical protein
MAPGFAAFPLGPFWQDERLALMRATDAIGLCRDGGYEQLPQHQTESYLSKAGRYDRGQVRDFILGARLTAFSLSELDDAQLFELLRRAGKSGDLVVVRARAHGAKREASASVQQRQLVRDIEARIRSALAHEGRKYRLVADADLARIPDRNAYEVVGREDAARVLAGLAATADPPLAALLGEARKRLTRDWRPPQSPDGLILLRGIVVQQSVRQTDDSPLGRPKQASAPEPVSTAPPPPEPETIGGNVDQASQAQTLVAAARDGVPFCEECARAAAGTGPP